MRLFIRRRFQENEPPAPWEDPPPIPPSIDQSAGTIILAIFKFIFAVFKVIFILAIMFVGGATLISLISGENNSATTPAPPPQETAFSALIQKYKNQYESADTELQKTHLRFERRDEMCAKVTPKVTNWIGTVYEVRSDYDQDARLTIQVDSNTYLDTQSYEIEPKSRLFSTLLTLNNGDHINFSGAFEPDGARDCFVELSFTESGGMTEPEFRFHFTSIKKE